MKRLFNISAALYLGVAFGLIARSSAATLEIRQNDTLYNLQSYHGVPLSTISGNPPGSDGRAPNPNTDPIQAAITVNAPTLNQFQSFISYGAVAAPQTPENLNESLSYSSNAVSLGLPAGRNPDGS